MAANNWPLIVALGGIRLDVPERSLQRAHSLLEASFSVGEEGDPIDICPSCRAQDVFRQPSWIVAALGYLIGHVPFLMMTRWRRCRACGHRWRATG